MYLALHMLKLEVGRVHDLFLPLHIDVYIYLYLHN